MQVSGRQPGKMRVRIRLGWLTFIAFIAVTLAVPVAMAIIFFHFVFKFW